MIYVIYGASDLTLTEEKQKILATWLKQNPSSLLEAFSVEEYSRERLEEAIVGQKLFTQRSTFVFRNLWSTETALLKKHLAEMVASPDLFLLIEATLSAPNSRAISDAGGKVKKLVEKEKAPTSVVNLFTLADAFGERDRRAAWLLYSEARYRGIAVEEIFWKVVWKLKTLLLVATAKDPKLVGLKPYPLQKALKQCRKFTPVELKFLSTRLVTLWRDARRGLIDFDHGLERLLLEV